MNNQPCSNRPTFTNLSLELAGGIRGVILRRIHLVGYVAMSGVLVHALANVIKIVT